MADPGGTDDPRSWSVDRVVQEFCHSSTPYWAQSNLKSVHDIEGLETLLIGNDIDGETLLELTKNDIQNDLHIASIGKRRRFIAIILHLCQCVGVLPDHSLQPAIYTASPESSLRRSILPASPFVGTRSRSTLGQIAPPRFFPQTSNVKVQPESPKIYHSIEHAQDFTQQPLQKRDDNLLNGLECHLNEELVDRQPDLNGTPKRNLDLTDESTDVRNHKRRRLAPEKLITQPLGPRAAIDTALVNQNVDVGSDNISAAEGVLSLSTAGIKSLRLEHSSAQDNRTPHFSQTITEMVRRKFDTSAVSALDTSGEGEISDTLTYVATKVSASQARITNKHIKSFMLGTVRAAPGSDKRVIIPYRNSKRLRNQRVILMQANVTPKVLTLKDKYEIDALLDEDDHVLPLYGDSDEEDRYVTEGSISDEDISKESAQQISRNHLTADQVEEAIQDFICEYKQDFWSRKLHKTQRAAHQKWKLARRIPELKAQILQSAQKTLDLVQKRLPNLIDEIHKSTWTKATDVRQQCDALSATIDLIEENSHYIAVLTSDQEPILPPAQSTTQPRPRHPRVTAEDEENCSSNDSVLEDFIEAQPANAFNLDAGAGLAGSQPDFANSNLTSITETHLGTSLEASAIVTDTDMTDVQFGDPQPQNTVDNVRNRQSQSPKTPSHQEYLDDGFADADDDDESDASISSVRKSSTKKRAVNSSTKKSPTKPPIYVGSSEEASDVSYSSKARKSTQRRSHTIDLTLSSPIEAESGTSNYEIRTPELNPVSSDKTREPLHLNLNMSKLPEIQHVRETAWSTINTGHERHAVLVLAKIIYRLSTKTAKMILSYIKSFRGEAGLQEVLKNVLLYEGDSDALVLDVAKRDHEAAVLTTEIFLAYVFVRQIVPMDDLSQADIDEAFATLEQHSAQFYGLAVRLLEKSIAEADFSRTTPRRQSDWSTSSIEPETESGLETSTDLDADDQQIVHRWASGAKSKTTRMAFESSMDVQRDAHTRMKEQLRLKAALMQILGGPNQNGSSELVAINFKEPIVYLDQHIAQKVKPHQIDGIQFMWRELIEDPTQQGCLLAHTMGLGKTMQVISLLVTIARCSKSRNPEMVKHIPIHLRKLCILIVCPPTLIDNWFNEFLLWMPKHDTLGVISKIRHPNQYNLIKEWAESGGVIITGYQRLGSYCRAIKPGKAPQSNEEQMAHWLLNSPSIVIADEAHMLKSPESQKSKTAMMLKTQSRIALTGSPLSNHLEEYWAMIEFVAPGYLGQRATFKHKFVSPINASLSKDSKDYERRIGLKKLRVLKLILQPKVHRADISALHKDLPPKTEFFISVPLTAIQKEIYGLFVRHFRSVVVAQQGTGGRGSILTWVAALSLLLNHPNCLIRKLEADTSTTVHAAVASTVAKQSGSTASSLADVFGEGLDEDVDILQDSAVHNLIHQTIQVFDSYGIKHDERNAQLSYRALVMQQILVEALQHGEKTLLFSHSIPTLNYLETMLKDMNCRYDRIDGASATDKRQQAAVDFNVGTSKAMVFLISTRAGGLGLNLQGATRVIIYDYAWNPTWEEQAVGRAYRIGQKQPVFVYRIRVAGTYEDITFNSAVFKTQLFGRVVDHKTHLRKGTAKADMNTYLRDPADPPQEDLGECKGKDSILDSVLGRVDCIRSVDLTETFAQDIDENLTAAEETEVSRELELERLFLSNPEEAARHQLMMLNRRQVVDAAATTMATISQARARPGETPGFAGIHSALQQTQPAVRQRTTAFQPALVKPSTLLNNFIQQTSPNRTSFEDPLARRQPPTKPANSHIRKPSAPPQFSMIRDSAPPNKGNQEGNGQNAPGCQTQ